VVDLLALVRSPVVVPLARGVPVQPRVGHLVHVLDLVAVQLGHHGLGNSVVAEALGRVAVPLIGRVRNNRSLNSVLSDRSIMIQDDGLLEPITVKVRAV